MNINYFKIDMKVNKMMEDKCPECGNTHFFINKQKGEVICKKCSFVLDDSLLDFGKDRMIDSEDMEKNSRSGAPFDPRVANNLITEVGNFADLRKLPKSTQMLMNRIRRKNRWTSSSLENNLNTGLANMKLVSSYLKLPEKLEKESARIYRLAAEKGLTRARSNENIVAASIYIACKLFNSPKSLNEVVNATKLDKKIIGKTYKMLLRELEIKIIPTSPVDFVIRFGTTLKLSAKAQSNAVKLIEKLQKSGLTSGKSPISIAATTLYISALINKERITQKRIAQTSGITETTLRNRCKEIARELGIKGKIKKK